jgi:hypothetical protein
MALRIVIGVFAVALPMALVETVFPSVAQGHPSPSQIFFLFVGLPLGVSLGVLSATRAGRRPGRGWSQVVRWLRLGLPGLTHSGRPIAAPAGCQRGRFSDQKTSSIKSL